MTNRKNLTPPPAGQEPDGTHAMRRGGARREVSTRVSLKCAQEGKDVIVRDGWALNVSRGGLRVILEEQVELGQEFDIEIGTDDGPARRGRIVWMQEEPDGVIVGIEFTGLSGTHKSAPPPAPGDAADASSAPPPASGTKPENT